jgi:hypothetical protein
MALFRALLIPLAVLALGVGALIGGRVGHVLLIAGTVLAGVTVVLTLTEA